ncbi:MAG: LytTR family DNA-binding domain-containing protein [Undibacterium sp.]|nr:LytTR family DNA-binding domain-containing protein [Undibacterium sp.]
MNKLSKLSNVRALIAEDEPILSLTLCKSLERLWPELSICAVAENGVEAVSLALKHCPDILFLDIKMPGKTGLEVAEELADEWPLEKEFPLIVFVTAYDEFAIDAFEHEAADYVLKPVSDVRLSKTVQRIQARLENRQEQPEALTKLIAQFTSHKTPSAATEKLTIIRAAVGNQIRMIPVTDVLYFEATDKYINVVCKDQECLIRMSLRELLPQLDGKIFWQIHRSYIVNTHYLQYASRDEMGKMSLKLNGTNTKLQVSRVYAHLFKQM